MLLVSLFFFSFTSIAQPTRIYDPSRNALVDYQHALISALSEHKNILVIAGGNWCVYCRKLEENLKESSLDLVIKNNFIFMKANFGDGNDNEGFFSLFPKFNSYPHILIISANGKLLESVVPSTEEGMEKLLAKYSAGKVAA